MRRAIAGLLVLVAVVLAFVLWPRADRRETEANDAAASASLVDAASNAALGTPFDAAIAKAVSDRAVRDELRRRILAGWADSPDEEIATAAKQGRFVPRPREDGTGIEPKYVQQVLKEDFVPMARKCYEELLARQPDAGGKLEMEFTIVADDELGGIVEDAGIADGSALGDEKMDTCIRESLTTLAFPPPAHGGVVSIHAPISFVSKKNP